MGRAWESISAQIAAEIDEEGGPDARCEQLISAIDGIFLAMPPKSNSIPAGTRRRGECH